MDVVNQTQPADGVALITLTRPEVHNSFNTAMADELLQIASELAGDPSIGAVVVTGAGEKAFCAGADVAEFGALGSPERFHRFVSHLSTAVEAIAELPQPVIAAVEGIAFGGGCELAMACDLRTASTRTRFGLPEIKLGLLPGLGGTQRAIRMLPRSVALRMLITGEPLDAETAFGAGFCERPVEPGGALADALRLADVLRTGPRQAIAAAKRLASEGPELDLTAAIALEQEVGRALFGTDDGREGVVAFLEKRPPRFGR
ncbi:MAG TPA: enoyl-CoA hydratase/isomerase family protein [Ilumatobacter sp.]